MAGFEIVEGVCRSEEQMIDLLRDADGAQVGVNPLTAKGNGGFAQGSRLSVVWEWASTLLISAPQLNLGSLSAMYQA